MEEVRTKTIRVLIVDDSAVQRQFIRNGLSKSPNIDVVGVAVNALDAKRKLEQLKPDVMTLDIEMPGMSGIDLLKEIMDIAPLPVIILSSMNISMLDALAAGALDVVRKPFAVNNNEDFFKILIRKIVMVSNVKPKSRKRLNAFNEKTTTAASVIQTKITDEPVIIGLGASTGGTEATLEVMRRLPADIPGMVIVQHMPVGFTKMYAERLNRLCQMEVREAVDGDEIRRGLALVAPADYQARVVKVGDRYLLACKPGEKVSGHRPSVDVLFSSMASTVRCKMIGIILTGMGRDGASGLLSMRQAGAYTIGQDKESCVVYGMPMVAQDIGAVSIQASCDTIASILLRQLKA